jgi:hypothetical protein
MGDARPRPMATGPTSVLRAGGYGRDPRRERDLRSLDLGDGAPERRASRTSGFRGAHSRRAAGRRAGGFGGNRAAARPGSARCEAKFDPSLTASRVDILSGLAVDAASTAAARTPSSWHGDRVPMAAAQPGGRSRQPRGGPVLARPVTPVLDMSVARAGHGAVRGSGQAFPLPRASWNANLPRPSSASHRSSRMEPEAAMYLRSPDWEPTQYPPEPEPEPPSRVQPTGRVYIAASTEAQREQELAEIHAKYTGGGGREQTERGSTLQESRPDGAGAAEVEELLCPKHRELAAQQELCSPAGGSRTRKVGFLFCGECFALQAARKQQQAEEERHAQQQRLAAGESESGQAGANAAAAASAASRDVIREAAEMRFGKSISDRMLCGGGGVEETIPVSSSSASVSTSAMGRKRVPPQAAAPSKGLARGDAGCWESADRDQPHHNFARSSG